MRAVTVAKPQKIELIKLDQIVNKFDVRVALDNDRVIQFAGLYEGGVSLPPVRLVKTDESEYAYIDGRTRGAARAYLNLLDVPAVICNGSLRDNPVELFAEALESNWGGAKPPSQLDIQHTIVRMLECGASQTTIRTRLHFLPNGVARAHVATARGTLSKRRLSKALDAVAEGLSVPAAAEQFKLNVDIVKNAISGKKGKWGKNRSDEVQLATDLKSYISKALFSANAGIGKKIEGLLKKVDDGDVSSKTASGVIKAWHEHLRKTSIRIADWDARLNAITSEQDKAVAATS